MKNNLIITALFLFFSCFTFGQENTINNIEIDSRENGTLIKIGGTKKINLKDVTAWYSSEWFYLTIYNAQADSTKLVNQSSNEGVAKIEIANNEESTQVALKLRKEIESFEITNPTRKNSFSCCKEEEAKKSIAMDKNIQEFSEENSKPIKAKKSRNKNLSQTTDRTLELSMLGVIVAISDIANPSTFLVGAMIALSTIFF